MVASTKWIIRCVYIWTLFHGALRFIMFDIEYSFVTAFFCFRMPLWCTYTISNCSEHQIAISLSLVSNYFNVRDYSLDRCVRERSLSRENKRNWKAAESIIVHIKLGPTLFFPSLVDGCNGRWKEINKLKSPIYWKLISNVPSVGLRVTTHVAAKHCVIKPSPRQFRPLQGPTEWWEVHTNAKFCVEIPRWTARS